MYCVNCFNISLHFNCVSSWSVEGRFSTGISNPGDQRIIKGKCNDKTWNITVAFVLCLIICTFVVNCWLRINNNYVWICWSRWVFYVHLEPSLNVESLDTKKHIFLPPKGKVNHLVTLYIFCNTDGCGKSLRRIFVLPKLYGGI